MGAASAPAQTRCCLVQQALGGRVQADVRVDRLALQLVAEARSKRYRGLINGARSDYEAYTVLHLAAQYQLTPQLTLAARINNLLDKDFTSFQTQWTQDALGNYTPTYLDDYNNKDKSRNLWLSINWRF